MRLFYVPGTCSLAPHIVLREAGLPFTLDRVDVRGGKKTQTGADYVSLNPKGYVPALELDDGELLTEASVIMQYIADLKPQAHLAPPAGTMERVRFQEWMAFISTELHKGMSPLYQPFATEEFKAAWMAAKMEPRWALLARRLEGRPYLVGDGFTVADSYVFYVLRAWQKSLKRDLSQWKGLEEYYARIEQRPSVQEVLRVEAAPV